MALWFVCMISTGAIGEVPILLAKPQTYMNFSGESVRIIKLLYHKFAKISQLHDQILIPENFSVVV